MLNILLTTSIAQKKTWEGIRKLVNIKKMSSKPSQLKISGKIIDDNKLATNFNNFFVRYN